MQSEDEGGGPLLADNAAAMDSVRRRSRSPSSNAPADPVLTRNLVAFWLLGLCNNFGYVVMLSAAKDILERSAEPSTTDPDRCIYDIRDLPCSPVSTGAVLLADILPSLAIKLIAPFTLHGVPYRTRHAMIVVCQVTSFLLVAFSESLAIGLLGVIFASLGAGLGEVTYLSLSSHFHGSVVSAWSSGTGGAGILGAGAFAALTDPRLLALTPKSALLLMLCVPATLCVTFWRLLRCPAGVHRSRTGSSSSYQPVVVPSPPPEAEEDLHALLPPPQSSTGASGDVSFCTRTRRIRPLLKYMAPLAIVYFSEYFINQGLLELLVFDCDHSFGLSPTSQYRWHQVLYQIGVFLSRSSVGACPLPAPLIPALALLQALNALFLWEECWGIMPHILPHLVALMALVLYEGVLGGLAYVNTFAEIHRTVPAANREFSMAFVALADSLGIVVAGFSAISAHNAICAHRRN